MTATELDRKFDAVMAAVTGPGGRVIIERDELGRAIVGNFPATLPLFFKTFCALNASIEAVICGTERLTYADLDLLSDQLARGLVKRGVRKGDRVAIAMRNCTGWVLAYMGAIKAGAIATLINGWWQVEELAHALQLSEPALILADDPRAHRIAATRGEWTVETIDIERPAAEAFQHLLETDDRYRA